MCLSHNTLDDFVLYCSCDDILQAVQRLQGALNLLSKFLSEIGLEISTHKSKVMVFKTGYRRDNIDLKLNGTSLQIVENYKYLGLWLDRSLRWSKHINELKNKALKFMNILKTLGGSRWGMHPIHLRRLYTAIVRSKIDYGCFLYDNSAQTHLKKIDIIQNQCLRIIGGFIKSTTIHVMESELHIEPLSFRRYYLAGKFWLKCKSFANSELINLIEELKSASQNVYWRNKKQPLLSVVHEYLRLIPIKRSNDLDMFNLDTWVSNVDISSVIRSKLDTVKEPKKSYATHTLRNICNELIRQNFPNHYFLFTDGSKDLRDVGAAFFDPQNNSFIKLKLESKISIMHAELIAVSESISYINNINYNDFVIFTDSRSALQHLCRCTNPSFRGIPIAYDIVKSISELRNNNKNVVLQWIPSHVGILENEKVDKLAKEASIDGIPYFCLPIYAELLYIVKSNCTKSWREHFDERSVAKGIWYKTVQPSLCRRPWFEGAKMSKAEVVTALRLRSGHMPLNSFAAMMGKVPSPTCSECEVVEDVMHIMAECVRNEAERADFLQMLGVNLFNIGVWNSILAFPTSEKARKLYKLVLIGLRRRN